MTKKLFIFDLDDTLYLRNKKKLSGINNNHHELCEYTKKITEILKKIKQQDKIITMASHNRNPKYILAKLGILDVFSIIIGEYPRKKDTMVMEILEKTGCSKDDAIFFDDHPEHIIDVKNIGVDTYFVESMHGIDLSYLESIV